LAVCDGSKLINGYTGVLPALYLPTLRDHFKCAAERTYYISSMWVVWDEWRI